jgi:hypothetical protein
VLLKSALEVQQTRLWLQLSIFIEQKLTLNISFKCDQVQNNIAMNLVALFESEGSCTLAKFLYQKHRQQ